MLQNKMEHFHLNSTVNFPSRCFKRRHKTKCLNFFFYLLKKGLLLLIEIRWDHTKMKSESALAIKTLMKISWDLSWLTGAPIKFPTPSVCRGVASCGITPYKTDDWLTPSVWGPQTSVCSSHWQGLEHQYGDWTAGKNTRMSTSTFLSTDYHDRDSSDSIITLHNDGPSTWSQ